MIDEESGTLISNPDLSSEEEEWIGAAQSAFWELEDAMEGIGHRPMLRRGRSSSMIKRRFYSDEWGEAIEELKKATVEFEAAATALKDFPLDGRSYELSDFMWDVVNDLKGEYLPIMTQIFYDVTEREMEEMEGYDDDYYMDYDDELLSLRRRFKKSVALWIEAKERVEQGMEYLAEAGSLVNNVEADTGRKTNVSDELFFLVRWVEKDIWAVIAKKLID